jgi:hypothetical protein
VQGISILWRHFPVETEDNQEKLSHESLYSDRNSNQAPSEYKSESLQVGSICSVGRAVEKLVWLI